MRLGLEQHAGHEEEPEEGRKLSPGEVEVILEEVDSDRVDGKSDPDFFLILNNKSAGTVVEKVPKIALISIDGPLGKASLPIVDHLENVLEATETIN